MYFNNNQKNNLIKFIFILLMMAALSSCASYQINNTSQIALYPQTSIAILTFENNTQTPDANFAASTIAANLLRQKGFSHLIVYTVPSSSNGIPGLQVTPTRQSQLAFAKQHNADYALYGSVNEWQYKVGLDSEPVAGVSLELIDLTQNRVVWSAVGSMNGSSREGLAVAGQQLLTGMLQTLAAAKK